MVKEKNLMSNNESSILERLIAIQSSLPNKQEQLCAYILENYQDIGLLTVKELADRADVGTTTVMRLVSALGYDSFFELKKQIHYLQIENSDKWLNVQKSFKSNESTVFDTLSTVAEESISLIEKSINAQLVENFEQAIELLEKSPRINLLGFRSYRGLAIYLETLLAEFHPNVQQLSYDGEAVIDKLLQCEAEETLIVFSFSNYTQRTIDAVAVAKEKGIQVILITDQLSCPAVSYAKVILKLDVNGRYFTVLPIITLIEAIVLELGKRNSPNSAVKIQKLFNVLKQRAIILE